MPALPPCGLYRTRQAIGDAIAAGRLVYFHNHGNPGPGVHLPRGWVQNRAQWEANGVPIPDEAFAQTLEPLAPEGYYRVREAFFCCEKRCRNFDPELLVQLGYDGTGGAILFVPEFTSEGLKVPETGHALLAENIPRMTALKVHETAQSSRDRGLLH